LLFYSSEHLNYCRAEARRLLRPGVQIGSKDWYWHDDGCWFAIEMHAVQWPLACMDTALARTIADTKNGPNVWWEDAFKANTDSSKDDRCVNPPAPGCVVYRYVFGFVNPGMPARAPELFFLAKGPRAIYDRQVSVRPIPNGPLNSADALVEICWDEETKGVVELFVATAFLTEKPEDSPLVGYRAVKGGRVAGIEPIHSGPFAGACETEMGHETDDGRTVIAESIFSGKFAYMFAHREDRRVTTTCPLIPGGS